jgi:hypothetical protein
MRKNLVLGMVMLMTTCLFFGCSQSEGPGSDLLSDAQVPSKEQRVVDLVESFRKDHRSGIATKAGSSEKLVVH